MRGDLGIKAFSTKVNLPIRSTKSPQASCPEGSLRSGAMVCAAPDLQWRGSRPRGAIVGEAGTRGGAPAPQGHASPGTRAPGRPPEPGGAGAPRTRPRGTPGAV